MKSLRAKAIHWLKKHWITVVLLWYCFSFLFASDSSFNQDLGRHIKLGEIIWNLHTVPHTNLFSYTFPEFPFINHHWLFQVFVYLGNSTIGIQGLLIIKVLLILTSVLLILIIGKRHHSVFFLTLSFILLHLLRGRIELRPEIWSFFFTCLTYYILELFETKPTKMIYFIPAISLLWVNIHIYYPVGIFLQSIFFIHFLLLCHQKKWSNTIYNKRTKLLGSILFLSISVSMLNPNGIKGMLYAFTVFNNYGVTITENQTMATLQRSGFISPDFPFFYMSVLISGILLFISLFTNKFSPKNFLLLSLGVILSFQSIRGFPYLFFLGLPALLSFAQLSFKKTWQLLLNGIVIILIIIESLGYLSGSYYQNTYRNRQPYLVAEEDGKDAMDFFLRNSLPQPIFNNFDIGSYILYRTYPRYRVYIDGRPEAYPASFFTETYVPMQEQYEIFKVVQKKEHLKTIVISITDQNPRTITLLRSLTHDPAWQLVYLDYFMVIFVRKDEAIARGLPSLLLPTIPVSKYSYTKVENYTHLSTFFYNMNEYSQAEKFNNKALELAPNNPAANRIMANILLRDTTPNMPLMYQYLERSKVKIFW